MSWCYRFPKWICEVVGKFCDSWNTKVAANNTKGNELRPPIRSNRGLPRGDALCPRLFTLCINPVAWKLSSTEGYRLSKPIPSKITNILYLDDLKVFAEFRKNVEQTVKDGKVSDGERGPPVEPPKWNVLHARRGVVS